MILAIATVVIWAGLCLIALAPEAWATDLSDGAEIFRKNCTSCHMGGANVILAEKNLRQAALHKYGMDSIDAIVQQVTYGKNAMPAFKEKLNEQQIKEVATFVLEQSQQGW